MVAKPQSRLITQGRAYRLWFEYLKVALQSTNPKVKSALVVSKPFYAPWEMDKAKDWNSWWKEHGHLFEEKVFVRQMAPGETPLDSEALILEVPLTQSPTILTKKVKAIITAAYEAQERKGWKSKAKPTTFYKLTEGAEPKFDAIREMLSVYRDVHVKNPKLRGEQLLEAVHRYYLGRRNKRWAKVPTPLLYDSDGDKVRAMRNLRRYIQKAEQIVLNVARGQFPGDY
jgi:hypothetical protein